MSSPYIGEVRLFAGNFAPNGWSFCNGSTLAISEFAALFDLIGTTYGGDGVNTFALPNLSGRVPIHQGNSYTIGEILGSETVTLTLGNLPVHSHAPVGSASPASQSLPGGYDLAVTTAPSYGPAPANSMMADTAVSMQGGSLPHDNMAPFVCMSYIISLYGIFPSQS